MSTLLQETFQCILKMKDLWPMTVFVFSLRNIFSKHCYPVRQQIIILRYLHQGVYMDAVVISLIFGLGYAAYRFGLPPLVGFLLAGFGLHSLGYTNTPLLSSVADTGVTLLLFTIGLKLKIKNLFKPEVWAGASIHLALTFASFGFILFILTHTGLQIFLDLPFKTALLLGFALSFSSTVFAVKILEESGRMNALNGRTAIGVLIIQDIIAVVYLTFSTGKVPSLWAIALIILLPVTRWLSF